MQEPLPEEDYVVQPDAVQSWKIFWLNRTQWRRDMNGPYALDYTPIIETAKSMNVKDLEETLEDIGVIEDTILQVLEGRRTK